MFAAVSLVLAACGRRRRAGTDRWVTDLPSTETPSPSPTPAPGEAVTFRTSDGVRIAGRTVRRRSRRCRPRALIDGDRTEWWNFAEVVADAGTPRSRSTSAATAPATMRGARRTGAPGTRGETCSPARRSSGTRRPRHRPDRREHGWHRVGPRGGQRETRRGGRHHALLSHRLLRDGGGPVDRRGRRSPDALHRRPIRRRGAAVGPRVRPVGGALGGTLSSAPASTAPTCSGSPPRRSSGGRRSRSSPSWSGSRAVGEHAHRGLALGALCDAFVRAFREVGSPN